MELFRTWFEFLPIIVGMMSVLWVASVFMRNASIVDPFWGTGFVAAAFYYASCAPGNGLRVGLLLTLVSVWGLRLSIYLLARNFGHGEDFRYRTFRAAFGERYWWVSFFQTFLLQGVLLWLISAPLAAASVGNARMGLLDAAGLLFWLVGFSFESIGDWQLAKFRRDPNNAGRVLDTGLWRYTRHPNYFGDAMIWWGYGLFAASAGFWWPLFAPALMMFFLMKVSGVALLEKSIGNRRPEYADYIRRTSAFFPWPPRAS